jgi:hypothetical protein
LVLGVRANRVIAAAFAISGLLAAAVSCLFVAQTGLVQPRMGLQLVIIAFVGTVIGGLGTCLALRYARRQADFLNRRSNISFFFEKPRGRFYDGFAHLGFFDLDHAIVHLSSIHQAQNKRTFGGRHLPKRAGSCALRWGRTFRC